MVLARFHPTKIPSDQIAYQTSPAGISSGITYNGHLSSVPYAFIQNDSDRMVTLETASQVPASEAKSARGWEEREPSRRRLLAQTTGR